MTVSNRLLLLTLISLFLAFSEFGTIKEIHIGDESVRVFSVNESSKDRGDEAIVYISRSVKGKVLQTIPLHGFDTLASNGVRDCLYSPETKIATVSTDANTFWVVDFTSNTAILK